MTEVHVFIRHGDKKHDNRPAQKFGLDPELTYRDREIARELVAQLYSEYGLPKRIHTSPFLRCRQTSDMLLEYCQEVALDPEEVDIPVVVEPELSEYFGSNYTISTQAIRPETLQAGLYIERGGHHSLHRRTKNYWDSLMEPNDIKDGRVVYWHVSHGTVISSITRIAGMDRVRLNTLGHTVIIIGSQDRSEV